MQYFVFGDRRPLNIKQLQKFCMYYFCNEDGFFIFCSFLCKQRALLIFFQAVRQQFFRGIEVVFFRDLGQKNNRVNLFNQVNKQYMFFCFIYSLAESEPRQLDFFTDSNCVELFARIFQLEKMQGWWQYKMLQLNLRQNLYQKWLLQAIITQTVHVLTHLNEWRINATFQKIKSLLGT
eukprot:TRINITY_DN1801_c0_g2_i3.p3 TRINITY_DN1801_c0_g2~~TRINITY_DN1801_c0_g2_i3.p3  ORF type:complete len:178 (-),score=1.14 TRINITY_DN1801_c0_g2_i3:110-643(-)